MVASLRIGLIASLTLALAAPSTPPARAAFAFRALIFTKTTGFRHTSIDPAVAAFQAMAAEHGFDAVHTEDAGQFTDATLAGFQVVVFLLTSGDVLDGNQEAAFQRYVQGGGGFAGVHSASDTEHGWPWFGDLVGGFFVSHPAIQTVTVRLEGRRHPSNRGLPARWTRSDEWYDVDRNPRRRTRVLATVSERGYTGGTMGSDHPIAWCHRFQGGRAWYSAMGHTDESYGELDFRQHLLGGVEWAAGAAGGACGTAADRDVVSIRHDPSTGRLAGGIFASPRRCEAGRRVLVERILPGPDRLVARDHSDGAGDWRTGFEPQAGRYRVVAPVDDRCDALRSASIVI